jgi:hypothetical protein
MRVSTRTIFARGATVLGISSALVLGTATLAAANPPVSMDGYLYVGTYSTTTGCMAVGDRLKRQYAIRDYFCHPVRRASWLYVDPIEDD